MGPTTSARWRVLEVTPKTPGPEASADMFLIWYQCFRSINTFLQNWSNPFPSENSEIEMGILEENVCMNFARMLFDPESWSYGEKLEAFRIPQSSQQSSEGHMPELACGWWMLFFSGETLADGLLTCQAAV